MGSLLGFALAAACGGGETGEPESAPGSAGTANVAGNSAGAGGAASSTSGTGTVVGGAGAGTGGSSGAVTSGVGAGSGDGAGSPSGSGGSLGGVAGTPDVPEPTDSGLSVYASECRGETVACENAAVHCLGIFLNEGGVGYTCSNLCRTAGDCSDAPSGAEARAGCVAFTSASRCVLVCYDGSAEYACPNGMGCYRYPEFPIGYCLWL